MYTEHWMSLEQNAISFRQNFTKTAISLGQEMIRSFIMIVQTTTLKSSRKMETKSMEKQRTQTKSDHSNGSVYGWRRHPPCFFYLCRKCKRTDIPQTIGKKILGEFGCQKFIYCSDAGLGSESIREYNHMGERAYIVTQSIKN